MSVITLLITLGGVAPCWNNVVKQWSTCTLFSNLTQIITV